MSHVTPGVQPTNTSKSPGHESGPRETLAGWAFVALSRLECASLLGLRVCDVLQPRVPLDRFPEDLLRYLDIGQAATEGRLWHKVQAAVQQVCPSPIPTLW